LKVECGDLKMYAINSKTTINATQQRLAVKKLMKERNGT
jgi:hypothetical protein